MPEPQSSAPQLVLASASPRRRELLACLGVPFRAAPAAVREDVARLPGESPASFAMRLAAAKTLDVATRNTDAVVLGADTIVVAGRSVLGKPRDTAHAREMLRRLRGARHRVITGVALALPAGGGLLTAHEETVVHFRRYTRTEVEAYIASSDPMDKAGAYAIQHQIFQPASRVEGCLLNVIGLPLCLVARLLKEAGLQPLPPVECAVPGPCQRRPSGCVLDSKSSGPAQPR